MAVRIRWTGILKLNPAGGTLPQAAGRTAETSFITAVTVSRSTARRDRTEPLTEKLEQKTQRRCGAAHWAFSDNCRVITIKPTAIKNNCLVF